MPARAARRITDKVYVYDMMDAPWTGVGRAGLAQKVVRADRERGRYLGLIGFEPMTRTGLHQHLGTAISYFLDGSLHDYGGVTVQGQAGINLDGATHDAVAYNRCVLVSRLEGPVIYPPEEGADGGEGPHGLHAGARHVPALVNPAPERPPEIVATVEALPIEGTALAGVTRRLIFDYARTDTNRRFVQLCLLPGTTLPAHVVTDLTEWFVLGGDVAVNGARAGGGSFVVLEPGTKAEVSTQHGARLLAWAEGPVRWLSGRASPDLYAF